MDCIEVDSWFCKMEGCRFNSEYSSEMVKHLEQHHRATPIEARSVMNNLQQEPLTENMTLNRHPTVRVSSDYQYEDWKVQHVLVIRKGKNGKDRRNEKQAVR